MWYGILRITANSIPKLQANTFLESYLKWLLAIFTNTNFNNKYAHNFEGLILKSQKS